MKKIVLLSGREKSLLRKHPWIYSGAIDRADAGIESGETVEVLSASGKFLAYAAWSPDSQLRGRVWSFDRQDEIGEEFFRRRIAAAARYRAMLGLDAPDGGCRLIYSEADNLPGIVVDRYAHCAAVQFLSAGAERHREVIGKLLLELPGIRTVFDRSDASIRRKEHLPERKTMLCGEAVPESVEIVEDDLRFSVDLRHGQKTGFYFDLRDARRAIRPFVRGRRVLNLFSYTGAFCCAALKAGAASVLNIDSSVPALRQSEINFRLNGLAPEQWENRAADGFAALRELDTAHEKFDFVILDPPKLIDSKAALMRGCRGYQDLARLGFKLLNPGGILCNFSCSGAMDPELFQKITAAAALEAGVSGRIVQSFRQSSDHPTGIAVPEGFYLKGLMTVVGD